MNVLFAGTPEFAVAPLKALCASHNLVGVFTQPDRKAGRGKKLTPPPVKLFALENNIPVFQPESLADQQQTIMGIGADVIVVVAYGMLLPQNILDIPPYGCLNIHASLLPRWRGAAPIQRAIEAGDSETGVSIMRMEVGLDTGPIFEMHRTSIETSDTSSSLHDKLASLGAKAICSTLQALTNDANYPSIAQDHAQANYAKKVSKAEAEIDWLQSSQKIDQRIRAFTPWPICQTHHGLTRIRIWQALPLSPSSPTAGLAAKADSLSAGRIIGVSEDGIDVNCGVGTLRVKRLQRDGNKPLTANEFCNGYPLRVGDILGHASP